MGIWNNLRFSVVHDTVLKNQPHLTITLLFLFISFAYPVYSCSSIGICIFFLAYLISPFLLSLHPFHLSNILSFFPPSSHVSLVCLKFRIKLDRKGVSAFFSKTAPTGSSSSENPHLPDRVPSFLVWKCRSAKQNFKWFNTQSWHFSRNKAPQKSTLAQDLKKLKKMFRPVFSYWGHLTETVAFNPILQVLRFRFAL